VSYILALDEGTGSARAAVYDREGRRLSLEAVLVSSRYPRPGWVEQEPEQIWRAQLEACQKALARASVSWGELAAIGITNQRETTIVWDRKTGAPVGPAIVWQCRRTAEFCERLAQSPEAARVTGKTGLVIDPYFSATKLWWILEHVPGARERAEAGELAFGTVDSWLVWKLTNGKVHVTDVTNASRTMLMNLATGDWDEELLRIFGVPRCLLPAVVPSSGVVATTSGELCGAEVPIAGIAGDQQAALFGQLCVHPGMTKNTYGTGCFVLAHTGDQLRPSRNRLLATRAPSGPGSSQFALEGSIFVAGAVVRWLRDQLGIIASAAESAQLAQSVESNDGVYFVPAFVGLGAPYWDAQARGLITGLTQATTRAHIVRAALESIAYQTRDLVTAMEADMGQRIPELRVDGGAAANDFLLQFQADVLGRPVIRPADIETTALGAAYLAGLAVGFWSGMDELEQHWRAERVFEPSMPDSQREELYEGWKRAVARCRAATA